MKLTSQIIIFILAIFTLMSSAHAQSPREQLSQMVEQLQKTPTDNALREKIIKLAREVKPAPAMPEEVERRMARGEAAFESAKDVSGYDNALREFQAAANAAPWYANAYFNLGTAQDKAGKAKAAMESFRFYLLSAPDGKDAAEVKKRIYKLEYAAEQTAAQAAAEQVRKNTEDFLIVPGRSIGPISMGMPLSQVESILGLPKKEYQKGNHNWATYMYEFDHGWFYVYHDERNVIGILTFSSKYRTRLGLAVGAHINEARREISELHVYGRGNGYTICSSQGIEMFVERDGIITNIEIGSKGRCSVGGGFPWRW